MPLAYFVDEIRTPFVINDIKRIAAQTDRLYLFSINKLEGKEALPENVTVFEAFIDWQSFKPLKIVFSNFFSILGIYLNECFSLKKILPIKKSIALLASNIYKAESVMEKLKANSSTFHHSPSTFYSFWFYDCIYLAWMRKKGWIEKAVTRAHGGDLFEERVSLGGKILFRHFQLKQVDFVLSISEAGTVYLNKKYPRAKSKIQTIYLGSEDEGYTEYISKDEDIYTIVSCARIRSNKRIHLIADMLKYIDIPIKWIHVGDENLNATKDKTIPLYLRNKGLLEKKTNVEMIATGHLEHDQIIDFYKQNKVDLFISLSEQEGVPVSMMEAISFGIPVLSTDVGGCKEIVTEKTGILIPLETEMQEIAKTVTAFKVSSKNTLAFRRGVRQFWEEHFDANKNYKDLFNILK